jgi:GTPase
MTQLNNPDVKISMIPVIAIVGRPNVGKSTLFNCLTKSRDALVANLPGVTRDRQYGEGKFQNTTYIVIDTGGLESDIQTEISGLMTKQSQQAMNEANVILFVVDARDGLMGNDEKIADYLRQASKQVFLVVNKVDGMDPDIAKTEFYKLGFEKVFAVATAHNCGISELMAQVLLHIPIAVESVEEIEKRVKIAIIGRPNVGKSTLVNRVLGVERVLVFDQPGTTRDSIFIPFQRDDASYILIDTAGVRRRAKITEDIEKFSVIKALQAIEAANVIIFVMDAKEGVLEQDLRLLSFIVEAGKAFIIAVNKWDGMTIAARDKIRAEIQHRLEFVDFARVYFISALHGSGVGNLFPGIKEAYNSAMKQLVTSSLTRILQAAVVQHQPPLVKGRRIKLRYAHAGGHNPPIIVIHGNQTESLPLDYIRYLINFFRKRLKLIGTPIRIDLKSSENPYKDKKNLLTPRQQKKRQRLYKHVKGHKK